MAKNQAVAQLEAVRGEPVDKAPVRPERVEGFLRTGAALSTKGIEACPEL